MNVVFSLLLLATFGCASLLDEIPGCAATCFKDSLPLSVCSLQDLKCLCADTTFQGTVQICLGNGTCTPKEILTTTNATYAACGLPSHDIGPVIVGIPATFGSLAIIFVLVRIYARVFINKFFAWDDRFIVLALVLARTGMGKDIWTLSFENLTKTLKDLYFAEVFYMVSEMFTQLSILFFYLRVFDSILFRQCAIGISIFVVCFGIANTFSMIFQCTPVSFFWDGWTGQYAGKCININTFSWVRAAIEIFIDITIISLPIRLLLGLKLNWHKKLQILAMFSVGFLITLVSILRLESLVRFSKSTNTTYDNAPAVYWSVLECDIAIVCACMPALRIILGAIFPRYFGSNFNSVTGESRRTPRNEHHSAPKSDPEADPITKTIASWTVGPEDRSRTPTPVEMNKIESEENKH
ncbi:conserved hypothetical protein [Talaromyces stipitatus ATCC 10500]|uniref:CFEM domain-containing protein n=1 Tax=Talaromyces stipitatus (strain ATCC 10500 / CBS 375.48 / QM 6759 / NRRL 1006) TaxID=441959 RepID=B8MQY5_TALSN|nr:uncharacterized protein TSTA_053380 [Talaromyces stipitatus ATCC 10500]EED12820.1 conserved hypothetical protein [Talaromyces stipitatus ATCC 10500]